MFRFILLCQLAFIALCAGHCELHAEAETPHAIDREEYLVYSALIKQRHSPPKPKRLFTLQGKVAVEAPEQNPTLTIDLKRCAAVDRSIAWGLGSETIGVKGLDKGRCVLQHYTEVEGGYSQSECRVPTGLGVVSIYWGGSSFYYSRDLSKRCKVIKTGNIFFDRLKP